MKGTIWAPWRMEYLLKNRESGCFLCRMLTENRDRENLLLKRGRHCIVNMNRYPYTSGHLLIAPCRHLADLKEMTPEERLEMADLSIEAVEILKTALTPDGLNLGCNLGEAAGAGLKDHIHQHIVPRWIGDTNFMPVLADIRIMHQTLLQQYDVLLPLFN